VLEIITQKYKEIENITGIGHVTLHEKNNNQTVNDGVAHSKNPRKCAYHVTFNLDLDLEHILDAR